jgi:hypothetical protein
MLWHGDQVPHRLHVVPGLVFAVIMMAGPGATHPTSASAYSGQTGPGVEAQSRLNVSKVYGSTLAGVSCAPGICVAVGVSRSRTGSLTPLHERWDGSYWAPIERGSGRVLPRAVSCTGPRFCMAVGQLGHGEGSRLAEKWDGTTWAPQPVSLPAGTNDVLQTSVSCSGPSSCQLVGTYFTVEGGGGPFADRWDGSRWSLEKLPAMPVTLNIPEIEGVSCVVPSFCEAVGIGGGGAPVAGKGSPLAGSGAFIEGWDGRAWSLQRAAGADLGDLQAVSCASRTFCEAVGTPYDSMAVAETWDGNEWFYKLFRLPATANSAELSTLSCATDRDCVATGVTMGAYVEAWDGTSWRTERLALSGSPLLYSVSCRGATFCEVVGERVSTGRGTTLLTPLAEAWDGTSWHEQPIHVA